MSCLDKALKRGLEIWNKLRNDPNVRACVEVVRRVIQFRRNCENESKHKTKRKKWNEDHDGLESVRKRARVRRDQTQGQDRTLKKKSET
jgi:hypothetical protein